MKKILSFLGGLIGYMTSIGLAVVFALYCSGRVGWFLVLTFIVAPILSLLFTFILSKFITVSYQVDKPVAAKGEYFTMEITVKNRLFLPSPSVVVEISDNPCLVSPEKTYLLSVMPFSTYSFSSTLKANICLTSTLGISSVRIKDYLNLFSFPVKGLDKTQREVSVIPDIRVISSDEEYIRDAYRASAEFGESEDTMDAPSYMFGGFPGYDHREYVPGDPLKRMNWKLSAKRDKLLIRLDEEIAATSVYIALDSTLQLRDGELENIPPTLYEYDSKAELLARIAENTVETSLGIAKTLLNHNLSVSYFYHSKEGFVCHHLHNEDYLANLTQDLAHYSFSPAESVSAHSVALSGSMTPADFSCPSGLIERLPEEIYMGNAAVVICTPGPYDTFDIPGSIVYSALDGKGRAV